MFPKDAGRRITVYEPMGPQGGFVGRMRAEAARGRAKWPQPINSAHEGYAAILEEVDELWDAVKTDYHTPGGRESRDEAMSEELVQIAALCMRMAEDLKLRAAQ